MPLHPRVPTAELLARHRGFPESRAGAERPLRAGLDHRLARRLPRAAVGRDEPLRGLPRSRRRQADGVDRTHRAVGAVRRDRRRAQLGHHGAGGRRERATGVDGPEGEEGQRESGHAGQGQGGAHDGEPYVDAAGTGGGGVGIGRLDEAPWIAGDGRGGMRRRRGRGGCDR